ncbi:hypothetical protein FOA52_000383 [Chlamydomonas sp. UWO 241]|nr:hypothetical protein FOA52_000383 [Chlamydomonas sp. UWO 241]
MQRPGTAQAAPPDLSRVEERITLHELIRCGVARQEDLRLLQTVAFPDGPPARHALFGGRTQLRECALREEWRVAREMQLLERVAASAPASASTSGATAGGGDDQPAAHAQQLRDQLAALRQIEEEQQAMARARRGAAGRLAAGAHARARPQTSAPASPARAPHLMPGGSHQLRGGSLGAAAALYGGGGVSAGSNIPRSTSSGHGSPQSKPLTPTRTFGTSSPYASGGGGSGGARATATPVRAARLSPGAAAVARRGSGGAGGMGASLSSGRGGPAAGSPDMRPVSAPPARPLTSPSTARTGGALYGGALYAAAASARGTPDKAQARRDALARLAAAAGNGSSRFAQLQRLHGTLLRNLEGHRVASGTEVATSALEANICDAHAVFTRCMAEAVRQLEARTGADGDDRGGGGKGSRTTGWDRMLRVGELGLTEADVARLRVLRRCQAARVIQRAARAWLAERARAKAIQDAQQRTAVLHQALTRSAAVVIQKCWRGRVARMRAAVARAAAEDHARRQRFAVLKGTLAAMRIQRAWRAHRKARRAKAALAASAAAGAPILNAGSATVRQVAAATTIQAAFRGWRARRSTHLWWRREVAGHRARRAVAAGWAEHVARARATHGLQARLVQAVLAESEMVRSAVADVRREREEFESSWGAWLSHQLSSAMAQPLPKGWVCTPSATQGGGVAFLNTRTGDLHAFHPSVQALRAHADAQRAHADANQAGREAAVAQYLAHVRSSSAQAQGQLLGAMAGAWTRARA